MAETFTLVTDGACSGNGTDAARGGWAAIVTAPDGSETVLTGGDTRAAYALWVPTAGGDFMVRPSHLDGSERLQFFGSDYTDHASTISRQSDGSTIYDATYNSM